MPITYITGGVRSGKSEFAEEVAASKNSSVLYVAFGVKTDIEMQSRIDKHQKRRPKQWGTCEKQAELTSLQEQAEYDVILIDCLSSWLANRCMQIPEDELKKEEHRLQIIREVSEWLSKIKGISKQVIIVSSEVGLGGVAMSPLGRFYQDTLGTVNQLTAQASQEAYAVLSGIPVRIKP